MAIGSNKELSVISKLKDVLPEGIGIGSGFVYDSSGRVSNQCDIILYESEFALKCCINDNEKDTYYNCESVIAVGEVKSTCGEREMRDVLTKFNNLAKLERYLSPNQLCATRSYLSKMAMDESLENVPIPRDDHHKIFKFLLCERCTVSLKRIRSLIDEITERKDAVFNTVLDISGKQIVHITNEYKLSLVVSDKMVETDGSFSNFIYHILCFINIGKTVPIDYGVYLRGGAGNNIVGEQVDMVSF